MSRHDLYLMKENLKLIVAKKNTWKIFGFHALIDKAKHNYNEKNKESEISKPNQNFACLQCEL